VIDDDLSLILIPQAHRLSYTFHFPAN